MFMHRQGSLNKMFVRLSGFCVLLGLISQSVGSKITPFGNNDILDSLLANEVHFVKIGDGYYYIESKNERNWFAAYESCRQINAALVSFNTAAELKLITEYLKDNKLYKNYWTSGFDLAEEGKRIVFSNGKPIFTDLWYPGEPNKLDENKNCFEMAKTEGLKLQGHNFLLCSEKKAYICQAPEPQTAAYIVE